VGGGRGRGTGDTLTRPGGEVGSMGKILLERNAFLAPVPVVLLTCVGEDGAPNILTVSWVSVVCGVPPMVGVAVRAERFSYARIRDTGEFVLNIPPAALLRAADFCGTVSGETVDKFAQTNLTPVPGVKVRPPMIEECPINLECVVRHALPLGSHGLFLAEVAAVHADADVVEDGTIVLGRVAPLTFDPFGGDYWSLKEVVAHHGFSDGTMPDRAEKKQIQQRK
jgi:flavin reductase (DIM6/NTAB) family NADH-FMN oxidoreductase RutF